MARKTHLRHRIRDGIDDLVPHKLAGANAKANAPLLPRQGRGHENAASELDDKNLRAQLDSPDDAKVRIREDALHAGTEKNV